MSRIITQSIDLHDSPQEAVSRYITVINENGISVHPAITSTQENSNSLEITDHIELKQGIESLASYGVNTRIGREEGTHIKIGSVDGKGRLSFYQGTNEVAYISEDQLYITKSVVLQQMDLGLPVPDGLGQWSWKVHPNGQNPSRNNLNLKWIG